MAGTFASAQPIERALPFCRTRTTGFPFAAAITFSMSCCWTFGRSRLERSPPAKPSIRTGISSPSSRELRPRTITTASAACAAATASATSSPRPPGVSHRSWAIASYFSCSSSTRMG